MAALHQELEDSRCLKGKFEETPGTMDEDIIDIPLNNKCAAPRDACKSFQLFGSKAFGSNAFGKGPEDSDVGLQDLEQGSRITSSALVLG